MIAEIYPGAVSDIQRYEDGRMWGKEIPAFFSRLAKSGLLWHLQGHHHSVFVRMVEEWLLTQEGDLVE